RFLRRIADRNRLNESYRHLRRYLRLCGLLLAFHSNYWRLSSRDPLLAFHSSY
ncbi:hypothetical protein L9F63_001360, partial [Diploptera punctata]